MDKDLAGQVVDIAQRVVASGAISANGHGNVRYGPGAAEMYFTAGPSLRDHPASAVVRVGLDGTLLEGDLPPIQGAVVAMHTAMYADHPDVGCVLQPTRRLPPPTRWRTARSDAGWKPWRCSGWPPGSRWPLRAAWFGAGGGRYPGRGHPGGTGGAAGQPRRAGIPPHPRAGHPGRRSRRGGRPGWHQRRRAGRSRRDPGGASRRGSAARHELRQPGNGHA